MQLTIGFTNTFQPRFPQYVPFWDSYEPGMEQRVITLELGDRFAMTPLSEVAEEVFKVTNLQEAGESEFSDALFHAIYDDILSGLRQPIRSLSVGDTVTWYNAVMACEKVGFAVVDLMEVEA